MCFTKLPILQSCLLQITGLMGETGYGKGTGSGWNSATRGPRTVITALTVTGAQLTGHLHVHSAIASQCFPAGKPRLLLPPTDARAHLDSFPIDTRFFKIQHLT